MTRNEIESDVPQTENNNDEKRTLNVGPCFRKKT